MMFGTSFFTAEIWDSGDTIIIKNNAFFGIESVYFNNDLVSKKWHPFGATHKFKDKYDIQYKITIGNKPFSWSTCIKLFKNEKYINEFLVPITGGKFQFTS